MLTADKLMRQGGGLAPVLLRRAASVELDWSIRQKNRFDTTDSQGRALGVALPQGTALRGGDVLVAQDGSLVRVIAAVQPVSVVTHCADHGTPPDLMRAAYELGSRHVPVEFGADHLTIEADPLLAGMLRSMHLIVREAEAAFDPEGRAATVPGHGHGHSHGAPPVGPVLHPDAYTAAPAQGCG